MAYTKRQYAADIAANDAATDAVRAELERFNARAEAGEPVAEMAEAWNAAHDREWELGQDRQAIESRWMRRKWTHADHTSAELAAANVE